MDEFNARLAAGTPPEEAMLESVGVFAADAMTPTALRAALGPEEAAYLRRVLPEVARLNARSVAAGNGPLDPAAARPVTRTPRRPGPPRRSWRGSGPPRPRPRGQRGQQRPRLRAGPARNWPGPGTVSARGPGAAAWPSTVQEAVAAGAARGGGSRRTMVRPAGVVPRRQPGPGR